MLIITHPVDAEFLRHPLVPLAQRDTWLSPLHDLLVKLFSDPKIQLGVFQMS